MIYKNTIHWKWYSLISSVRHYQIDLFHNFFGLNNLTLVYAYRWYVAKDAHSVYIVMMFYINSRGPSQNVE